MKRASFNTPPGKQFKRILGILTDLNKSVFRKCFLKTTAGFIFLPIMLLPLLAAKRTWAKLQTWLIGLLAITTPVIAYALGCGG